MEKKYSRKHIGEEFITNEGYKAKIIDGGSKGGYCTIQIYDWIEEVLYHCLNRGTIKYPYHRSVKGVGYLGEGRHITSKNNKNSKPYATWLSMLERCYDPKYHIKFPTYIDYSVDPRWHNYQVFAEWFENNYYELDGIKFQLDKDLLAKENKTYSPKTCIFIPRRINTFLSNEQSNNKSGYTGVHFRNKEKMYVAQINHFKNKKKICLGYFKDPKLASIAYNKARSEMSELAKDYMRSLNLYSEETISKIR